jgi:hypothetical protein
MREAWVQTRAIPELQAALKMNRITLYRAGEIAKLPAGQQEIVLAQWTNRSLCRSQGQEIAAAVIRKELKRTSKVDLDRVASAIRDAIGRLPS